MDRISIEKEVNLMFYVPGLWLEFDDSRKLGFAYCMLKH